MLVVRASSLNSSKSCPAYSVLARKSSPDGNKYTRTGTVAHAWLEDWVKTDFETADSLYQERVDKITRNGELELSESKEEILSQCHEFSEWYGRPFDECEKVIPEGSMSKKYDDFGVMLTGSADVIAVEGNHVVVIDWKMYSDPNNLPSPEDNFQLKAYAVMAADIYGCETAEVQIGLVRQLDAPLFSFSKKGLQQARKDLESLLRNIALNPDMTIFGPHCGRCFANKFCNTYSREQDKIVPELADWNGKIESERQALELAMLMGPLKDRYEQVKKSVDQWVENKGPIQDPVTKKWYAKYTQKKKGIDQRKVGALQRALRDIDPNVSAKVSISMRSLSKAVLDANLTEKEKLAFYDQLFKDEILTYRRVVYNKWQKKVKNG